MRLLFNDKSFTYENTLDQVKIMFDMINQEAESLNLHISHLVVDGNDVYENHGDYIIDRLSSITTIEVITKTTSQLIKDILNSSESYLVRALPEIESLVDEFYNNPIEETWDKFGQLLEGIQWLVYMVQSIDQFEKKLNNWNEYLMVVSTLQNELNTLMEAMENQDTVLIADIIQYEILPLLTALKDTVTATIDSQGERDDLS